MKIIITYDLDDSWADLETAPPEIIHETMLEQIEKFGFPQGTTNVKIEKILDYDC